MLFEKHIDTNRCVLNISEVFSLNELLQCKFITEFAYVFGQKSKFF